MKRSIVGILVLVLIFGSAMMVSAETNKQDQLSIKMVVVAEGMIEVAEGVSEGTMSTSEAQDRMNELSAKAKFIYLESLDADVNPEFVKLAAGFTLTIDLYRDGYEEMSMEKLDTANKIFKYVLTPQLDNI